MLAPVICRGLYASPHDVYRVLGAFVSQLRGWGHLQIRIPMEFMGGSFGRVHKSASRICSWFLRSIWWLLWVPTPFLCSQIPPNYLATPITSVTWVGWNKSWLLGQCLTRLGKQDAHSTFTFPHGRNHRLRGSPLALSYAALGEGWLKWNCFSYPLQCIYLWIFCSSDVLESFHWTPGFPQRYSHPWWLSKLMFIGRGGMRTGIPFLPSCWHHQPSASSDLYHSFFQKIHWWHNKTKGG